MSSRNWNAASSNSNRRESHMKIGTGLLKFAVAAALAGGLAFGGSASASALGQVKDNVAPAVAKARLVGHHSPSAKLDISVALKLRNPGELDAFIASLHDRSSPNFHKFLTPAQFRDTYGPTQAQVDAVKAFLAANGIKVTSVSANRTRVHGTATTAVMESAFGVAINDYKLNGTSFYAASTNPSLPAGLASSVSAVMGLENASVMKSHAVPGPAVPQPRSGIGPSGYGPGQIASFYSWPDITDTANGSGVTIAIATAFTFRQKDLVKFWDTYDLPHHTVDVVQIDGATRVLNGETTLDIERSSSMAPGANIRVYEASTPAFTTFDDEFVQIATDGDCQVVSTSWGSVEREDGGGAANASIIAEHASFQQMASQGQVVLAAAGDNGSSDGSGAPTESHADFPSSDPYVLAAGGTTLPNLNPGSESAWSGAGGADSVLFAEPDYQVSSTQTVFVGNAYCDGDHTGDFPDDTTDTPNEPGLGCTSAGADSRQTSDLSMNANPGTGYSIYYNGRWEVFGGTSFVAPELAGMFAILVSQNAGAMVGNGNALVYCAANDGNYATTFNDVTSGDNGGFAAVSGWDHPTGWGTPIAADLLTDMNTNCVIH